MWTGQSRGFSNPTFRSRETCLTWQFNHCFPNSLVFSSVISLNMSTHLYGNLETFRETTVLDPESDRAHGEGCTYHFAIVTGVEMTL